MYDRELALEILTQVYELTQKGILSVIITLTLMPRPYTKFTETTLIIWVK